MLSNSKRRSLGRGVQSPRGLDMMVISKVPRVVTFKKDISSKAKDPLMLKVKECDIPKMAFQKIYGHFEFVVMSLLLTNAPLYLWIA